MQHPFPPILQDALARLHKDLRCFDLNYKHISDCMLIFKKVKSRLKTNLQILRILAVCIHNYIF